MPLDQDPPERPGEKSASRESTPARSTSQGREVERLAAGTCGATTPDVEQQDGSNGLAVPASCAGAAGERRDAPCAPEVLARLLGGAGASAGAIAGLRMGGGPGGGVVVQEVRIPMYWS